MAREPNTRLNVTLDAQYAEKLSRLAERTAEKYAAERLHPSPACGTPSPLPSYACLAGKSFLGGIGSGGDSRYAPGVRTVPGSYPDGGGKTNHDP